MERMFNHVIFSTFRSLTKIKIHLQTLSRNKVFLSIMVFPLAGEAGLNFVSSLMEVTAL